MNKCLSLVHPEAFRQQSDIAFHTIFVYTFHNLGIRYERMKGRYTEWGTRI